MRMEDVKVGQRYLVTGDSADAGHCFGENTEVKVLSYQLDSEPGDPPVHSFNCQADDGDDWYVDPADLAEILTEPTEQEIAEAFGLKPPERTVLNDRDALAAAIYDPDLEWLTTVDGTPNSAAYEIADRLLASADFSFRKEATQ